MGSWRSRPWLLWALLAVPAAATLAGVGTYAGALGPQDPPRPGRADLVGRYEDGRGGAVTLHADGTAVLEGIAKFGDEGDEGGYDPEKRCDDKEATWSFLESRPRWSHRVAFGADCGAWMPWDVEGTAAVPEIVYWTDIPGHPDSRRVLTRR
ncbi:hypothetical protein [Streptomyces sp. NRRL F-5727]|uniref:hypothetical protein n=1 Tax=Streptomyces sp. NRRL F-5727 TaxID=1463871 RepID=UPI0004C51457|nr:hypothetical protein [Streptomyces sp. NRRL F-5727]